MSHSDHDAASATLGAHHLTVADRAPLTIVLIVMSDRKVRPAAYALPCPVGRAHLQMRRSSLNTHKLGRLRAEHDQLEQRLKAELQRQAPNTFLVRELKQRKLEVRDEIIRAEFGSIR